MIPKHMLPLTGATSSWSYGGCGMACGLSGEAKCVRVDSVLSFSLKVLWIGADPKETS